MYERYREDKPQGFQRKGSSRGTENERGKHTAGTHMEERTAENGEEGCWQAVLGGKEYFKKRKTDTKKGPKKQGSAHSTGGVSEVLKGILAQEEVLGCFFDERETEEGESRCKGKSDRLVERRRGGGEENKFENECGATREGAEKNDDDEWHI